MSSATRSIDRDSSMALSSNWGETDPWLTFPHTHWFMAGFFFTGYEMLKENIYTNKNIDFFNQSFHWEFLA